MNVSEAFKSRNMKSMLGDHMLRNGLSRIVNDQVGNTSSLKMLPAPLDHVDKSLELKQRRLVSVFSTVNKLVRGKLSLGAKISQTGGVDNVFRRIFSVREGEQLLRASQCSLSTTAGPIAGRLFISSHKIAFCSDRAVAKVSSPSGESLRFHYKIVIPLRKINRLNQHENTQRASQKYLLVETKDNFEFWFMGFRNYKKTFRCLQQAVPRA